LLYDIPHGASLSIVYPAWLRLHLGKIPGRIQELVKNLFGTETAEEGIEALEKFFVSIGSPVRLSMMQIPDIDHDLILDTMIANNVGGNVHKLSQDDYQELIKLFR